MGIQNLSSEARGFLYELFNKAAAHFEYPSLPLSDEAADAANGLANSFEKAAFRVERGSLADVNAEIDTLAKSVKALTDPGLKDAVVGVQLMQQLMYRNIRRYPQLQADLGTYASGIF